MIRSNVKLQSSTALFTTLLANYSLFLLETVLAKEIYEYKLGEVRIKMRWWGEVLIS